MRHNNKEKSSHLITIDLSKMWNMGSGFPNIKAPEWLRNTGNELP